MNSGLLGGPQSERRSWILSFAGSRVSQCPDLETYLGEELHLLIQGPGWTWPAWAAGDSSCGGCSGNLLPGRELGK